MLGCYRRCIALLRRDSSTSSGAAPARITVVHRRLAATAATPASRRSRWFLAQLGLVPFFCAGVGAAYLVEQWPAALQELTPDPAGWHEEHDPACVRVAICGDGHVLVRDVGTGPVVVLCAGTGMYAPVRACGGSHLKRHTLFLQWLLVGSCRMHSVRSVESSLSTVQMRGRPVRRPPRAPWMVWLQRTLKCSITCKWGNQSW